MLLRLILLALALGLAHPVAAQQPPTARSVPADVHLLEIRNGRIWHDGRALPDATLPEGLDIEGLTFTFEYSGPVTPALSLNGRLYALEGDQLVELDEAELAAHPQAFAVMPEVTFESVPAQEAQRQAQEAYLQTLSERDRALYEQLMREREMEAEALRLAYSLRRASDDAARTRLTGQLRTKLEAIFELKQENRREEVQQVEALLEALRAQLQERESMKDKIIDHRMRELTGQ